MAKDSFTVALAQLRCELLDKDANLKRMITSIAEAKQQGAECIVFPELFLSGYVINDKLHELAESVEGPSIKMLQDTAKNCGIKIIAGFPEASDNKLYNSAIFIDSKGEILNVYRKTHLYHNEKEIFTEGEHFSLIKCAEGNIGILITYDVEFPEMARKLAANGAEIVIVLAANMVPYQQYQDSYLHARAMENHLFMVAVNKVGLHIDNVFFGESQVIDPKGQSLYKGGHNEELAVIKLHLPEIKKARGFLDYLNNRREDLYNKPIIVRNK